MKYRKMISKLQHFVRSSVFFVGRINREQREQRATGCQTGSNEQGEWQFSEFSELYGEGSLFFVNYVLFVAIDLIGQKEAQKTQKSG